MPNRCSGKGQGTRPASEATRRRRRGRNSEGSRGGGAPKPAEAGAAAADAAAAAAEEEEEEAGTVTPRSYRRPSPRPASMSPAACQTHIFPHRLPPPGPHLERVSLSTVRQSLSLTDMETSSECCVGWTQTRGNSQRPVPKGKVAMTAAENREITSRPVKSRDSSASPWFGQILGFREESSRLGLRSRPRDCDVSGSLEIRNGCFATAGGYV
jgi:hypothetical protein